MRKTPVPDTLLYTALVLVLAVGLIWFLLSPPDSLPSVAR